MYMHKVAVKSLLLAMGLQHFRNSFHDQTHCPYKDVAIDLDGVKIKETPHHQARFSMLSAMNILMLSF